MANIHSTITYNANLSAAQAQIKTLTGQIGALTAAFNTLDKSALSAQRSLASTFAIGVGQVGGFTTSTIKATNAVETFGRQIATNRLTMRQYFREAIAGYTNQSSLMRRLAEQQVRYQQSVAVPTGGGQAMMMTPKNINLASNAAALASQRFAIFNKLIDGGATSMLNWGKNTQWAGRQLMVGFTVPLMLFTAVASKQFRELDRELTRFQKVYGADLGNAISDSTNRMREQVKQLAYDISSTYGVAAKDTAALAADIAATGREGEALISSVQQTTRLAVLGEVDRQEAMKATLSLQSAFRMNTNELAESINFLNAVENQTSATLEDLATAIPKVGPVVRSLGGDVKDLATLLVAMREGGIPAAEAANALKSGLSALINPTKQASDVAKQFGIDLVGIVEANKGQLMPTIYAMQDALAGLDSFGRSRVIEQIFGRYQFARITALFDNIGRAGSQTQSVVDLASKSSAELAKVANDELRTLTESTAMRFQRTMEDLKNAIMPIGQTLTETLIPIFEFIGSGMKTLTSFFQSLPGPVKDFAKYGVAIAALAGPIIMMVGLFGNLIANGIKFGMMMTRLGARIAGIKVEKFELLSQDVMAAKLGVDGLTKSFDTQEVSLRRLTGVLSSYEQSLRRLTTANPALFIPGAIPAARGQMPIRRQTGSTRPEFVPGSGRGDKIPAMLEPGEFIVNRAATEKYAPVLMAMNRGNLQGFQQGTQLSHLTLSKTQSVGSLLQLPFLDQGARAMLMLIQSIHGVDFQVKTYSNAVLGLSTTLNQSMERGQASIEMFRREISDSGTAFDPLAEQLRVMIRETGEFSGDLNLAEEAVSSFAQQMRAQAAGFKGRTFTSAQLDAMTMAALSGMTDPRQRAAMSRLLETPTSFSAGKGLTASNMYLFGQAAGVPMYTAGEGRSRRIYANIGPEQYLGVRPRAERIPLGNMPTYQGAQISPLSLSLPLGATRLQNPGASPTFYDETGRAITKSIARSMGGTKLELFERQIKPSAEQFVDRIARIFAQTLSRVLESSSPSKRMDREVAREGKNFGDGAASGFIKGYKSSAAGKPIVAGPVGGTGVESISNAQKIVQADQSILKLKQMQLKHTADRVRADVELVALSRRYASGEINLVQFLEQKKQLELQQKDAADKELRIQNLINQKKQAILDADQAQIRAEQEETRNAQRRAAASASLMFGMGAGGSMGYFRGGTSPYVSGSLSAAAFDRKIAEIAKMAGPSSSLSNRPTVSTGPAVAIGAARDNAQGGMRGMGAMNAVFALSMVTSSISMLGGASADTAAKMGMFSTALMTATMLMNTGVSGKGIFTNFLGLGSLGKKASITGRAMNIAAGGASRGGAALMGLGRGLSLLGGPVGIAAGIGITAAITGFMMYRNAAEEARERAIAAFNDPVKSAEYFGETIMNVSDIIENNRLSNLSEDLRGVDKALREAASQDYAPLIEQIKYLSEGAGAQQLSVAYSNMIVSGMSAENAKATIEAIAAEAGMAGGKAFSEGLSKGLFDQEITIQDAIGNIVNQFSPKEMSVGGSPLLEILKDEEQRVSDALDAAYSAQAEKGPRPLSFLPDDWYDEEEKNIRNLERSLDAIRDRIEDVVTINPELLVGTIDSLVMAYQKEPTAAIDGFEKLTEIINNLEDPGDREAAIRKLSEYLRDTYGEEWAVVLNTIDTAEETVIATQMAIAGISLDKAINDAGEFDAALARAAVSAKSLADATRLLRIEAENAYFGMIDQFAQEQRDLINVNYENFANAMDDRKEMYQGLKDDAQDAFEVEQEARQASIKGMQDEMDARRRAFDEQMQQLDDRSEAIEKSSDAYINSLEKSQKAESFYAQQRKTAFGALEKLASGDVFGFLQEREQMSADAQDFSYDQMITGIEERRDLELDAIDEVREQKRREQEEYEQMMEDRIQGVQDLMDKEQEAHDDRMEFYDAQIERADTAKENALIRKNEEIDGIETMEGDYRTNSTTAEREYSKEYTELKTKPYTEARKEMLRLRIEEIYYRGGVTLGQAVAAAGALSLPLRGRSAAMGIEGVLSDLGLSGEPGWKYRPESVGDTGVGNTAQQVRDMTVTADSVTINGDVGGFGSDPNDLDGDGKPNSTDPDPSDPRVATGGYIQNGRVMLEGGGKVSGPGGPKSDVIPAMLSNGEYVVQASSVSKYGKSMMDSINSGKFATGGYVSADRAATAASNNVYLGGWKPKPQYSGGTPTYTGGYSTANTQSSSNPIVKKNKWLSTALQKSKSMRPGIDYPLFKAPTIEEEVFGLWNSLRAGIATATDALLTQWIPPFLRNSSNSTTSLGRSIGGEYYSGSDSLSKAALFASVLPIGKGGSAGKQLPLFGLDQVPLSISPVRRGPAPGTVISIGRGVRGATGILQSGKFKNMFETDTTTGSTGFADRAAIESRGWGLPFDAPATDRPIYGLLRNREDVAFPYGEALFDIKYDPSKRTSYSPMDTKWASIPEGGLPDLKQNQLPGKGTIEYAEVWQNNVRLKDIETAHFAITDTMSDADAAAILNLAQKYSDSGVPVVIHNFETNLPYGQWTNRKRGQMFLPGLEKFNNYEGALMANGGLVQKFANGGPVEMKKALDKWAGPKLKYHGGWSSAGSWGKNYPAGILMHHTSKPATDAQVDAMKNGYVWNGQFVKGPIVQSVISRDGTGHIIGYGNRNVGSGEGTTRYMDDKELGGLAGAIDAAGSANAALFQMEVISNGLVKDFTSEQFDTIAKISSGLREWMGWGTFDGRIINHKDWAVGRKNDTLYNRSVFVNNANKAWSGGGGIDSGENKGGEGSDGKNGNRAGNQIEGGPGTRPRRGLVGALSLLGAGNKQNNVPQDSPDSGSNPPIAPGIDNVLSLARKYQGLPYYDSYPIPTNDRGEPTGWGCATSVAWLYKNGAKITLPSPSLSYGQYAGLKQSVSRQNIAPGDLIFYKNDGPSGVNKQNPVNHVEMYMGPGQIFNGGVGIQSGFSNHPIIGIKRPAKFASGGFISGPGGPRSDMIPAMLSNGEYVVKASSVAKYGKGFMDKINSGSMNPFEGMSSMEPRMFANGGIVGSSPMPAFSMPEMSDASVGVTNTNYGGSSSSTNNSTKVNVVINGSGGKSANAIANKVISMINSANNRRNHSRSI